MRDGRLGPGRMLLGRRWLVTGERRFGNRRRRRRLGRLGRLGSGGLLPTWLFCQGLRYVIGGRALLGGRCLGDRLDRLIGRLLAGLRLFPPPAEQTFLFPALRGLLVVVGTKHECLYLKGAARDVAARKTDGYPSISSPDGAKGPAPQ
ncbi:hypothetical protein VNPA110517_42580 [Pseudomonas aeruginosa]|nr:hypothetical protein VNPA110517_42580 [Pseudomonas aeruginosa]